MTSCHADRSASVNGSKHALTPQEVGDLEGVLDSAGPDVVHRSPEVNAAAEGVGADAADVDVGTTDEAAGTGNRIPDAQRRGL